MSPRWPPPSCRIGALGLPFALIALAGQGYLRGIGDLRRPLVVAVIANVVNVILELVFVYGLHWGLAGSAWGTVIAQSGMGAAVVLALLAAPAGVYAVLAALSLALHWGIVGVWAGFDVLMLVRLATCGERFRSGRWAVAGAG